MSLLFSRFDFIPAVCKDMVKINGYQYQQNRSKGELTDYYCFLAHAFCLSVVMPFIATVISIYYAQGLIEGRPTVGPSRSNAGLGI